MVSGAKAQTEKQRIGSRRNRLTGKCSTCKKSEFRRLPDETTNRAFAPDGIFGNVVANTGDGQAVLDGFANGATGMELAIWSVRNGAHGMERTGMKRPEEDGVVSVC